jgi:tRNA pseudouridine65 synthase
MALPILFQDAWLVAIHKPHGLLVHRSPIARDAEEFALQLLAEQLGRPVWPVHRLDRKTSGILLFALDEETNRLMQQQFMNQAVKKSYLAIVRGHTPLSETIDYALTRDDGKTQEAITHFTTIDQSELDVPSGKFSTSRYSLVQVNPETGRMHQIRKHFAHIFHPIIGDRPHGCNKQNKLFKENWNMTSMMLHASELTFHHPHTKERISITCPVSAEFNRTLQFLKLTLTK